MFRVFVLASYLCLYSFSAYTQGIWTHLNSNSVSHFEDIEFISLNHGFTVGTDGTLLRTANGGLSWDSIPLPSTSDLHAIDFPTAATGFLVGEDGSAFQSSDSGSTWTPMSLPVSYHYHDVFFMDVNLGWVIGRDTNDAMLLKTTDGGQSWQSHREPGFIYSTPQAFGADYDYYQEILVLSEDDVFVGGYNYSYGGSSEYRPFVREFDMSLNLKTTGFTASQGFLTAGVSGLANPKQEDILVMLNRGMPNSTLTVYGDNWFLRPTGNSTYGPIGSIANEYDNYICLHFADSLTAYVSRYIYTSGYGIYQTDGGGINYTDLSYPGTDRIHAIDFPSQGGGNIGYFAGSFGTIYKYEKVVSVLPTDEGEALQVYPNPTNGRFHIQFPNGPTSGLLKLYDVAGRQVKGYSFENKSTLDSEFFGLPEGIYMLKVEANDGRAYMKKVRIISP